MSSVPVVTGTISGFSSLVVVGGVGVEGVGVGVEGVGVGVVVDGGGGGGGGRSWRVY